MVILLIWPMGSMAMGYMVNELMKVIGYEFRDFSFLVLELSF